MLLQYPGFEPGLPRPQRGVLTTILILLELEVNQFFKTKTSIQVKTGQKNRPRLGSNQGPVG